MGLMLRLMATMADVARAAGVSTTTVSHVLNGTRPVSDEAVARVRAAIEQTGYSHNALARGLARGGRTQSLGLAISSLSNPYFGAVMVRTTAKRWARAATRGRCSQNWVPGTDVGITRNGP